MERASCLHVHKVLILTRHGNPQSLQKTKIIQLPQVSLASWRLKGIPQMFVLSFFLWGVPTSHYLRGLLPCPGYGNKTTHGPVADRWPRLASYHPRLSSTLFVTHSFRPSDVPITPSLAFLSYVAGEVARLQGLGSTVTHS